MKLPQTLIIESPDIIRGFETAMSWAKANLCLKPAEEDHCTNCRSCSSFDSGNHPDFILIEKPEDKKNIPIDMVRERIISKINSKPLLSQVSIVIIKDAHLLSESAQNALLKTLEEPPAYLRIILTVDNTSHLKDTIISRSRITTINQKDDGAQESRNLVSEIINMDLPQRFKLAKEIADRDKKEGRKDALYTLEFIDSLIKGMRAILKSNFEDENLQKAAVNDLNKVLADRRKILYNTNKLLVLENLMLQTLDSKIYKNCKS